MGGWRHGYKVQKALSTRYWNGSFKDHRRPRCSMGILKTRPYWNPCWENPSKHLKSGDNRRLILGIPSRTGLRVPMKFCSIRLSALPLAAVLLIQAAMTACNAQQLDTVTR